MSENDSNAINLLGCGGTSIYMITKEDTIMVGDTVYYNTVDGWIFWNISTFIREDTIKGQLFCYIKELGKEFLICNMSLNLGDTFRLPQYYYEDSSYSHEYYLNYHYREEGAEIIVDSIASINGKKVIYFSNIKDSYYYNDYFFRDYFSLTFIEGIGPTYGPFGYITNGEKDIGILLCVEKDDTLTHITSPKLGCYQSTPSIEKLEVNPVRLYPNPANDKIQLELNDEDFLNGTIHIIDPVGQIVYSTVLTSMKKTISISHLSAGMYVLQYNLNNKIFQSKFLKINER
jgi:hypothetical protein